MRRRRGFRIDPWGAPVKTGFHDDICPFKATLCNAQEGCKVLQKSPKT